MFSTSFAALDAVERSFADEYRDLLDHARSLHNGATQAPKRRNNGRNVWADLNIDWSAEAIDKARQEMKTFVQDDLRYHPSSGMATCRALLF